MATCEAFRTCRLPALRAARALRAFVLAVPAGTPPEAIAALNSAAKRALETPALRDMMARDGTDIVAGTPEEAAAYLKSEAAIWAKVVKDGNLQP